MAARAKGRPKPASSPRPTGAGRNSAKATGSARSKPPSKAASNKKKSAAKSSSKTTGASTDTSHEMLLDQNAALRAELEQAQARVQQLEELNKNVANRIDWVIDSLQGALQAKR